MEGDIREVKSSQSPNKADLANLLKARFPLTHVDAIIDHYQTMIDAFQNSEWEGSIVRAGKLVESSLKALWVLVGRPVPRARDFKVDVIIRELERVPAADADDSIRLTIPRAGRFVYDIASNRGARHDPDEIDPNVMDAAAAVSTCAWIVAEMLRYSQKGSLDPSSARELVYSLARRKFQIIEDVDGRVYFHMKGLSARTVGLLTLWRVHPGRISRDQLVAAVVRHRFSEANARTGISRLQTVVDSDSAGNMRLLLPGVAEAEELLATNGH